MCTRILTPRAVWDRTSITERSPWEDRRAPASSEGGVTVYAEDGELQGQGGANLCAVVKQAWLQQRQLSVG